MDIIFGDEDMSDHKEETPAVSTPQIVPGMQTISVLQSIHVAAAGTSTVVASQSSKTAPATQAVPHSKSGPKDIRMQTFIMYMYYRRNMLPMEKMKKQVSHSFQMFPHLKYLGSH